MRRIYFDNNATTPLAPEVREAMLPYLSDSFGNPSSGHRYGEEAKQTIDSCRQDVAALINCDPDRLIFTSGGTEANNTSIWSAISALPEKKHILSSSVEHDSVLTPLRFLQEKYGYEVELLPVDSNGSLDIGALNAALRPDTVLASFMSANNETGVLWPIEEIGNLCREKSVLFHCDAVQMVGKEIIDVGKIHVDYLSIAAHKLHGPKGIGALYTRRTAPMHSLLMGAGQEKGRRAGTENVAGIAGLAKACQLAAEYLPMFSQKTTNLRDHLEEGLLQKVKEVIINGSKQPRLSNSLNISIKNCAANAIIQELDERGIAVSAHSACHSGDLNPSHVLTAMGIPETYIHGTLRISLSRYNTMEEVETLLGILPDLIARSRQIAL